MKNSINNVNINYPKNYLDELETEKDRVIKSMKIEIENMKIKSHNDEKEREMLRMQNAQVKAETFNKYGQNLSNIITDVEKYYIDMIKELKE